MFIRLLFHKDAPSSHKLHSKSRVDVEDDRVLAVFAFLAGEKVGWPLFRQTRVMEPEVILDDGLGDNGNLLVVIVKTLGHLECLALVAGPLLLLPCSLPKVARA